MRSWNVEGGFMCWGVRVPSARSLTPAACTLRECRAVARCARRPSMVETQNASIGLWGRPYAANRISPLSKILALLNTKRFRTELT
jgi:hypothetical protein